MRRGHSRELPAHSELPEQHSNQAHINTSILTELCTRPPLDTSNTSFPQTVAQHGCPSSVNIPRSLPRPTRPHDRPITNHPTVAKILPNQPAPDARSACCAEETCGSFPGDVRAYQRQATRTGKGVVLTIPRVGQAVRLLTRLSTGGRWIVLLCDR